MPPRIHSQPLLNCVEQTCLGRPSWQAAASQQCSQFSTTASRELNREQRRMWQWLRSEGRQYRNPKPGGGPNYLAGSTNKPFRHNETFRSQPVLSEEARNKIWSAVMEQGLPLKAVSAKYSVDMRRVAAVVRMKEIERSMQASGQPLARPYAKAVLNMLPQTHLVEGEPEHEPINEIHIHSYTMQQLFLPTPESRKFTRADAAKAFGDHILPAEKRIPLPELVGLEKDLVEGLSREEANRRFMHAAAASEQAIADREARKAREEEENKKRVDSARFEFRFENINAEAVGPNGRSRKGVGWRYGVPFHDRKRAEVKIPTKVE
ncbi:eukaryotic mitochondrial regulator protein-domain-containing protein [Diplogelasinospora grovesii]|uniref:Eukaryotic mitochondrial regulator protein-domain-containing protein n=1 Tax=Diplogelasinospora grovesii TaxID=303347 RepID=A0AAN6NDT0_9PEZI|nr:eukaryotic mitochondrial regulator protein-domain-containing protein [Diplogelasinospora grovesii]